MTETREDRAREAQRRFEVDEYWEAESDRAYAETQDRETRVDSPEYRAWYDRGWRYSGRDTATLDHGDRRGYPESWYDGYLDHAAGREKWHLLTCDGSDRQH